MEISNPLFQINMLPHVLTDRVSPFKDERLLLSLQYFLVLHEVHLFQGDPGKSEKYTVYFHK